jgi:WD40 repeat protein
MSNNARVKTILILAANPQNTAPLRLDREIRQIDEGLRRANKRELYKLEQKWAVRSRDFYRAILDYQPHIVHFCGHGAGEEGIVLEDDTGKMALVQTNALASMFKLFAKKGVECVILNACYSEVQAEAISQYVNYVVGMNRAVGDRAAVAFAVAFYDAIAAGYEVEEAYELGCSQMMSFRENEIPVLKTKKIPNSAIDDIAINFEEVIGPNPYQGLAAFGEEDADFFFGQEKFVNNLVEVTHKQPLVAVVGPSGSGKSSAVFAGLIPKLRKEGNWLIEIFRPGKEPFLPLASALVRQLEPEAGETQQLREAVGLAGDMQQGRITLQQVVSRIFERNPGKRLLLVADQFEELYTLCQVKEEQERFVNELLRAIAQENITLVLTLRADFYGYVLSYRPLRDALQEYTPQLLSSMKREELQAAIELPAQKLEVQLEPRLTQRILDDVGEEPGNLPLLEFALTRLWEKQINRELTHQAYEEIGGVKKAIANHAEQVYQQLSETEKKQAQRIFVQLVRPGEGTEDTRRIATRAEVGEDNWNLVSYLAGYQARLVVTGRQEPEDTVEVVHEALIREWGTLREWVNANRDFRTWQERLKVALREWKNNNHDSGALLRGVPLNVAAEWLRKRAGEMTQEERDFIEVSVRKQKRRRQFTTFGVSGAFIVVSSLAIFANWQWWQVQRVQLGQSDALSQYSNELFNKEQKFDALIASLRGSIPIKRTKAQPSMQVLTALRQAVYGVNEHRLEGHSNSVSSVAFSPDRKTLASASDDNTIKLWNLQSQKPIATLAGHSNWVSSVAFSPDGLTLASASGDNTIKLWNLQSQKPIATLAGHSDWVNSVAFSPDGLTLASASLDKTIKVWNLQSQKPIATLAGHSSLVNSVAFSPDGLTLASASADDTIKLWNLQSQKPIATLAGHSDSVNSVAFSPDGLTLASASLDNTIKVWNVQSQKPIATLAGHSKSVNSVAFSPDGLTLASASFDNTIKLWNLQSQKLIVTLAGDSKSVNSVAFSPDGLTLASASGDNTIKLWNLQSQKPIATLADHSKEVSSVAFSPDGLTLASASSDNTIKLWNLQSQKPIATLAGHSNWVSSVAFSPDGLTLASASGDNTIKLWNLQSQKPIATLAGHSKWVISVAFSPDGLTLASASGDNTIKLWNLQSQKPIATLTGHSYWVSSVAFSPDGLTLASASRDNTIKLWNLQSQKSIATLVGHSRLVYSVAFSPDGLTLASASRDNTIKLWNLQSQKPIATLAGHSKSVNSVAFSPDGLTLASASLDKTIKVWNLQSQKPIATLAGHSSLVSSIAFSPDGLTLASASADKTIILWNFDFDDLLKRGCDWVRGYLESSPYVSDSDRHLCDGIPTNQ